MASMTAVRQGIVVRLQTLLPEAKVLWYEPEQMPNPAIVVMPDTPFVDYRQAHRSPFAEWKFVVSIIVGAADENKAQEKLSEYLDPDGVLIAALLADGVGDELEELCNNNLEVMSGTNYGAYHRNRSKFLIAQVKILVRA